MLRLENVTKYYGSYLAIENISFEVNASEIFGFVGKNGAGKSTTIRSIMNLIKKSGNVYINDELFDKDRTDLKEIIGYLPSEIHLYPEMKVSEIFKYFSSFYNADCSSKIFSLTKQLDIDINKRIEELSLGNLKKVAIVLALMHSPKVIIMDEATSGLDPLVQEVFYKILLSEKKRGACILFSSHNLNEIKKISDRVGIIKDGKIIKIDDIGNLVDNTYYIVTIESKDIKDIQSKIGVDINNNKFIYKDNINKLIKILNDYDIDNLLIEDAPIEDVFMHYYGG